MAGVKLRIALLEAEIAAPVTGPFEIREDLGYSGLGLMCHQTIMQCRGRCPLEKLGIVTEEGPIPAEDVNVRSDRVLCFCSREWF